MLFNVRIVHLLLGRTSDYNPAKETNNNCGRGQDNTATSAIDYLTIGDP